MPDEHEARERSKAAQGSHASTRCNNTGSWQGSSSAGIRRINPRQILEIGLRERDRLRAEHELEEQASRAQARLLGDVDPALLQQDLRFQGDASMYTMDMQMKRRQLVNAPLIRDRIEELWEIVSVELEGDDLEAMRAKQAALLAPQDDTDSDSRKDPSADVEAASKKNCRSSLAGNSSRKLEPALKIRPTFDDGFCRVLQRRDYVTMSLKLQKCMNPSFTEESSRAIAIDDWAHDTTRLHHRGGNASTKLTQLLSVAMTPSFMTYEQFHLSIFELVDTWVDDVDEQAYALLLQRIEQLMLQPLEEISFDAKFLCGLHSSKARRRLQRHQTQEEAARENDFHEFLVIDVHEQLPAGFGGRDVKTSKKHGRNVSVWEAVRVAKGECITTTRKSWFLVKLPQHLKTQKSMKRPVWMLRGPAGTVGRGISLSVSCTPSVVYACFFHGHVPKWLLRHSKQWKRVKNAEGVAVAQRTASGQLHAKSIHSTHIFCRVFRSETQLSLFNVPAAGTSAENTAAKASTERNFRPITSSKDKHDDTFVLLAAPLFPSDSKSQANFANYSCQDLQHNTDAPKQSDKKTKSPLGIFDRVQHAVEHRTPKITKSNSAAKGSESTTSSLGCATDKNGASIDTSVDSIEQNGRWSVQANAGLNSSTKFRIGPQQDGASMASFPTSSPSASKEANIFQKQFTGTTDRRGVALDELSASGFLRVKPAPVHESRNAANARYDYLRREEQRQLEMKPRILRTGTLQRPQPGTGRKLLQGQSQFHQRSRSVADTIFSSDAPPNGAALFRTLCGDSKSGTDGGSFGEKIASFTSPQHGAPPLTMREQSAESQTQVPAKHGVDGTISATSQQPQRGRASRRSRRSNLKRVQAGERSHRHTKRGEINARELPVVTGIEASQQTARSINSAASTKAGIGAWVSKSGVRAGHHRFAGQYPALLVPKSPNSRKTRHSKRRSGILARQGKGPTMAQKKKGQPKMSPFPMVDAGSQVSLSFQKWRQENWR